jgi:hypothetical protein
MDLTSNLKALLATNDPPDVGPGPRPGVKAERELDRALDVALGGNRLPRERLQLIRAIVLLWHDHLDSAHTISQSVDNADGAFVHGIMHRREPDYGNAGYWFRRVGSHPAFGHLGQRAKVLLEAQSQADLRRELLPRGAWDPLAFIHLCERGASLPPSDPLPQALRELQRVESETLLDWLSSAA